MRRLRLPSLRTWRRRVARLVRVVAVALALLGLTPLPELGAWLDAAEHGPAEIAAAPCADDCDAGCADQGCHGDVHHCGCCAPAPRVASSDVSHLSLTSSHLARADLTAAGGPLAGARAPPWQPPRA